MFTLIGQTDILCMFNNDSRKILKVGSEKVLQRNNGKKKQILICDKSGLIYFVSLANLTLLSVCLNSTYIFF